MRSHALAAILLFAATTSSCTFSAHPKSGAQSCSNDNPPQCPDGYTCVASFCYDSLNLPATGGTGGGSQDSGAKADATTDTQPDVYAAPCGQADQSCCTGSLCTATNAVCSNGQCKACGDANQPCCAGDVCSGLGTTCADTSSSETGKACLLTCVTTTLACTQGTDQDCTTLCGPSRIGSRTCTCTSAAWTCVTCIFPADADYACYALPATIPSCQAATLPTLGEACALADCVPCGAASSKAFIDLSGTTREGFCVCTNSRWNCAPAKEWPCPGNPGC